ncbi:MAG: hypothetical protein A3D92_06890 [Bacteroidetes bacterium RIFCSPHIGHO2_02_FULL_44_7]|nr:MAG: hypothetical protein A3D92_06890 [Bacteroidetes bacterium RIFCSPHIGHO2_02_FULL_44_7]
MRVCKFGVELNSLGEEDMTAVFHWRNQKEIVRFMVHQDPITWEEHRAWFEGLNVFSQYLMIQWQGRKIGVFNIKNIDWKKRSGEAGIFIGDPDFRNTYVPMLAILGMMDVCFNTLGFHFLEARVRKDNPEILRMNQDLGYRIDGEDPLSYFLKVGVMAYHEQRKVFQSFLEKFNQDEEVLELSDEESAFFLPVK